MATTTSPPSITRSAFNPPPKPAFVPFQPLSDVPVTVHSFPDLEPRCVLTYSPKHLYLPLRRDILHLAVTYEGDNTRSGNASSKTRYEVHGSHRKVLRQKGSGRARAGSKQSPLRKGGGKTFGPKPRDFGTEMNRKVYDLAWRTALSYRYRRGELIITEDGMELPLPANFLEYAQNRKLGVELEDGFVVRYMNEMMMRLPWGKKHKRTTYVTSDHRPNLFTSLGVDETHGKAINLSSEEYGLDVKNLLETGRIVMEVRALNTILGRHSSDLVTKVALGSTLVPTPQALFGKRR